MQATLFVLPGSHPSMAARLMLEAKGIDHKRIDLVPVLSKGVLRAVGFAATTVPALKLDGRRIQTTAAIARELDRIVPLPPLFGRSAAERAEIEQLERWADQELQQIPRRIIWNVLGRDRRGGRSYLEGARLGLPVSVAAKTSAPLVYLSRHFNGADDEAVRRDLAALPAMISRIDAALESGLLGSAAPNAADYQVATSLRLLMSTDDVRPLIEDHPAAAYARRVCPEFPGHAPAALPHEWTAAVAG